ncbi:SDR family NAD(P)-dependent oxidoreductase [Streptomyces sp. YGL11-2]|uniref:SDR family NAD(P)-dependent oxidoreductase n=1 Tax=Streptomyces sp. YGL11-2 TaxID=3414028 RepID=UPI003CEB5BDD
MSAAYLDALFSLTGRRALVTGGSSGIGRAIAEALGRAGAEVVLMARREGPLRAAAGELRAAGCAVGWVAADLGDRDALREGAAEAVRRFGEPDILVHAAGVNPRPPMGELSTADWDRTMAVNLDAAFLLGQRFGPGMADRGWGRILHIASQQSVRAFGNSGAYGVSKAGLAALTRSQAEAWSRHGVSVNALAPGFVHTPLNEAVFADPVRAAAMAGRTMAQRNGEPADFAGAAVFLAGPGAAYVTGQTVFVDGGFSVT